jgi:hypothetical protein
MYTNACACGIRFVMVIRVVMIYVCVSKKALLVETYVTDARLGRPSCFKPEKNELKYGISATVARAIFLAKQCIHRPEYQLYNLH